jgi:flagellar biosynthesis/type III secretory pathway protein FliH
MGLIRRADAQSMTRDAVVLDLSDLEGRGAAVLERARREADKILSEARAERDRLISGARDEGLGQGREAGHAEGLEAGRAEGRGAALGEWRDKLAAFDAAWGTVLDQFTHARDGMLVEARTDVVRLAVLIAERVIKRAIEHDPSVVRAQMGEALGLLSRRTRARVAVHPEDEALAREASPALLARFDKAEHIEIETDPTLARGSCVVRTDEGGGIDASIAVQLDGIVRDLLPEDARAPGENAGRLNPPGAEAA